MRKKIRIPMGEKKKRKRRKIGGEKTYMTWVLGPCVEEIEDVTIVKTEIFHGENDRSAPITNWKKKPFGSLCNLTQFLVPGSTFYGQILCGACVGYLCTLITSEPLLLFNIFFPESGKQILLWGKQFYTCW